MPSLKYIFSSDRSFAQCIKNITGLVPGKISLYRLAFQHRSVAKENEHGIKISNERLEYLGDAVLGAVIADMLFKKFPYKDEGFLTEMRSKIVSRESLKRLAMKLGIDKLMTNIDIAHRSVYGDAFEALIGALYLDKGYQVCYHFIVHRLVKHHIDIDRLQATESNFKSKILNWGQKERRIILFVETDGDADPEHFFIRLLVDEKEIARGQDISKKKAEQIAAQKACEILGIK